MTNLSGTNLDSRQAGPKGADATDGIRNTAAARPRLLFVDDESRILLSLKAIFRAEYDVTTVEGGAAALEVLKQQRFNVIVSDQRMPDVPGVEVLRVARDLQPQAIRMLLTGYSDLNAIIASINDGEIFRFIPKPWVNSELRETVAAAVRAAAVEHVELPEPPPGPQQNAAYKEVGVLVLDEDPQTAIALRGALGSEREVYAADSIETALELLGAHRIGVIFTELSVVGQSVAPLLGVLRQHHPALVVVAVTANADASHSISLINHGQVFRLLQKPVTPTLLRGTVNIASRRYEMLRQHPDQAQRVVADTTPMLEVAERTGLLGRIRNLLRWV
jgi:DNA-binding NtrC family response regulator